MMKNKSILFVLAASSLMLAACGGDNKATSSTADSSKPAETSTPASSPAESSSSSTPVVEKVNIAYADDTFIFAGEGAAGTGRFVYWAGDGGTVSSATKTDGTYSLSYKSAGNWYGVQLFYKLPYAEANDAYSVKWNMNSDVAGDITINGNAVSLVAGDNALSFNVAQGGSSTLSVQLGVNATSSKLGGALLKFTTPVIYDNTANAKYNEVKFINGTATVKDIQVKNGKTVAAPADPTPATGYVFDGWYNGTTEFNAASAVSAPTTYTAKFIAEADAVRYTVTFMNGTTSMGTAQVIKGKKIIVPSTLAYPFGNTPMAWYKEAALTNAWVLDTDTVTADVTLYAKMKVTATSTFMNTAETGNKIPDANISNNADGSLKIAGFAGWGSGDAWVVQVNFLPIPVGVSGTNYAITFKYKINGDGGDVKICDINSGYAVIGNAVTLSSTTDWVSVSMPFAGAAFSANTEVTFELGKIPTAVTIDLEIADFALTTVNA